MTLPGREIPDAAISVGAISSDWSFVVDWDSAARRSLIC